MRKTHPIDRFVAGRGVEALSLAWGWAEAAFFFVVPDVLLTLVACRALRRAIHGALVALAGALAGGTMLYAFGAYAPERARSFLAAVPGIGDELIMSVRSGIDEHGLVAVMVGPTRGVPYKIYAVEWGARRGSLAAFLLASLPARFLRFLATILLARGAVRLLARWTGGRADVEARIWGLAWTAFYVAYFAVMGW